MSSAWTSSSSIICCTSPAEAGPAFSVSSGTRLFSHQQQQQTPADGGAPEPQHHTFCFVLDPKLRESQVTMPLAVDLMHPSFAKERARHKKKRLVQSPNSYFMDVKCIGCYRITTIFSHAQTVVPCAGCSLVLCQPGGGKCRLTAGCAFRRKYT